MATSKRFTAKNGLDNNGNSIINVANPTNAQDVATKNYADVSLSTWTGSTNFITAGALTSTSLTVSGSILQTTTQLYDIGSPTL